MLARLIVWKQGGITFVLDESGRAKDVNGNAFEVTDDPVAVAHPMEMSAETVKLAQENDAVNVLAQLMEYKNSHYAEFDPMVEFTLEW